MRQTLTFAQSSHDQYYSSAVIFSNADDISVSFNLFLLDVATLENCLTQTSIEVLSKFLNFFTL